MNNVEMVEAIRRYPSYNLKVSKTEGNWWGGQILSVAPDAGSEVSIHFHEKGYLRFVNGKSIRTPALAHRFDVADVTNSHFHDSGFHITLRDGTTLLCAPPSGK